MSARLLYRAEICQRLSRYRRALTKYARLRNALGLPSVVIGATGIASLGASLGIADWRLNFASLILSSVSVVCQAVMLFLRVERKLEQSKRAIRLLQQLRLRLELLDPADAAGFASLRHEVDRFSYDETEVMDDELPDALQRQSTLEVMCGRGLAGLADGSCP